MTETIPYLLRPAKPGEQMYEKRFDGQESRPCGPPFETVEEMNVRRDKEWEGYESAKNKQKRLHLRVAKFIRLWLKTIPESWKESQYPDYERIETEWKK